jgi:hypothetical protein
MGVRSQGMKHRKNDVVRAMNEMSTDQALASTTLDATQSISYIRKHDEPSMWSKRWNKKT